MPDGRRDHPEEPYRSLFEHHPHAVFLLDLQGRFVEVNPACARISGTSVDDLLDTPFTDLLEPDDAPRATEAFARAVLQEVQEVQVAVRHADGRVLDVQVSGIPWLVDGQTHGVYGVAQDVTEANRVVRDLETTQQHAAAAGRAKSDFVARMSHEIRTPLTSILSATELLATSEADPEQQELIATLGRAGERLRTLVDDVLDFAEAGALAERTELDLHALLDEVVTQVRPAAAAKGLRLHLELGADVPHRIRDQPGWTRKILLRLLTNAVDHTTSGGVELAVSTTGSACTGLFVLYRVSDTGAGIDPAHHGLVFEPFAQVPSTVQPHARRTGLGLSTVQRLVAIAGGRIAVDSAPDRGSTFFVTMPVDPVLAADPAGPADPADPREPVDPVA